MLQAIAHSDRARPSDIATALQLHPPQVSRQVQALADEGLLEIASDSEDKRSRLLTLTDAGRAEVSRLTSFGLRRWRHFLSDFELDEVRELGRLLAKLGLAAPVTDSAAAQAPS